MQEIRSKVFQGLNCDPQELVFNQDLQSFVDRLEYNIEAAKNKCELGALDWRYVAGRLKIYQRYQNCGVDLLNPYKDVKKRLLDKINNQYSFVLKTYSQDDLKYFCQQINPAYDLLYDIAGAFLLTYRYLQPNELPQECYIAIAMMLASNEPKNLRNDLVIKIYHAIASHKISLATPILANLRVPNGNLASCFIIQAKDDLDSITECIKEIAKISKAGGGVGINVSKIRSKGSWVNGRSNASNGVIPWIKSYNDIALAVDQGGVRTGAVTVALDVWHYDVPDFLEIQTENGDQRIKSYDVFPQLVVPDRFMELAAAEQDWYMFDPYEVEQKTGYRLADLWGSEFTNAYEELVNSILNPDSQNYELKLYRQVNAKELYKDIMRTQLETGMPYIAFKDTINRANPNKNWGIIPSVNLCCESFSVVKAHKYSHCCNLASLNLANLDNIIEIKKYAELAVTILDNTIELTEPPLASTYDHNRYFRTIGLGSMGLADYLAKNGKEYQDLKFISCLFEDIAYFAACQSVRLAAEKGTFEAYSNSSWSQGELINCKSLAEIQAMSYNPYRWQELHQAIAICGIRNSQLLAIAPNTSSSLVQGCTASVLPAFKDFFIDQAKGSNPVAPPYIDHYPYQINKHLDQSIVVAAMAEIAKWTDTGISMELLFNLNQDAYAPGKTIQAKDIFDVCFQAWKSGCKTIYYIRSVQKDSSIKETKAECNTCAN